MYVDDTDMFMTGKSHETPASLQDKTQKLVTKWCNMLQITGGALRLEKCWWYLITFQWYHDGNWKYTSTKDSPANISIPDYRLKEHKIKIHEPRTGNKGLRVYLATDGNNIEELDYLEKNTSLVWKNCNICSNTICSLPWTLLYHHSHDTLSSCIHYIHQNRM